MPFDPAPGGHSHETNPAMTAAGKDGHPAAAWSAASAAPQ